MAAPVFTTPTNNTPTATAEPLITTALAELKTLLTSGLETDSIKAATLLGIASRYGMTPDWLQEGVVGAGDLKVTTNSSGLQLAIAAGTAWIADDGPTYMPVAGDLVRARLGSGTTVTASAAHATLPRIDQVVASINGYSTAPTIQIVTGTATAAADLDNRNGAAALPASAVRLADILVPAAFAGPFVNATHIRDRRPWARGAFKRIIRTSNAAAGNDYTQNSASVLAVDGTNLSPRVECSGAPVVITLTGSIRSDTVDKLISLYLYMDGVDQNYQHWHKSSTAGAEHAGTLFTAELTPTAGSHLFAPYWNVATASVASLIARSTNPLVFTVQELARQNASND